MKLGHGPRRFRGCRRFLGIRCLAERDGATIIGDLGIFAIGIARVARRLDLLRQRLVTFRGSRGPQKPPRAQKDKKLNKNS